MTTLTLSANAKASLETEGQLLYGQIVHVAQNTHGFGQVWTPIAKYYVRQWHAGPLLDGISENILPHTRIDCYVREHELSPNPEALAKQLLNALIEAKKVSEPIWLSWHRSRELGGTALGEIFDLD
jgi:hypothetical protein